MTRVDRSRSTLSSTVDLAPPSRSAIAHRADRAVSTTISAPAAVASLSMFGMGMGRGNSSLRTIRIGLLVMVILAGVVFRHSGGAYDTIRGIYYVLIVGFLVFAIVTRRRAGLSRRGTAGGSWGGSSGGSWGNRPPPAQPPPASDPPAGTAGGSWGNSPPPAQPPPSSDPPAGLVNNEHDLGPNVPPSDPPAN